MNLSPRTKLRLLGLLPLFFFLTQVVHYWRINQLGHLMWMCNIGNLLLALGLFLEKPVVVRLAAIWTIPGLLIWFLYVVLVWELFLSSVLAHVGGLLVAMVALRHYGMDRRSWRWAFGWYLVVQLLSRFFTPPELNVNLAHAIQPGWEEAFPSYWSFWLVLTIVIFVLLWVCGLLLFGIFHAKAQSLRKDAKIAL